MIFSSSDLFYEVKIMWLAAYLFFYALPFVLAYFQIWFFFHISLHLQQKYPAVPRRIRFPAFALLTALCFYGVSEVFFTSFRNAAEFLHIYLTM